MNTIRSLEDLNRLREKIIDHTVHNSSLGNIRVIVSLGSCGIAAGALNTMNAIREQIKNEHLEDILLSETGCSGLCTDEPIVQVIARDQKKVTYRNVTPMIAQRILREHIRDGEIVHDYVVEIC